jgi:hypothetical protein
LKSPKGVLVRGAACTLTDIDHFHDPINRYAGQVSTSCRAEINRCVKESKHKNRALSLKPLHVHRRVHSGIHWGIPHYLVVSTEY